MNKLRFFNPKRLSSSGKRSKDNIGLSINDKSCSSLNDELSSYSNSFEKKESSIFRSKPSNLKFRSLITFSDPDMPINFKELFDKDSSEIILKRYKCVYVTLSIPTCGKLYVSTNFFIFVETNQKRLQVVIRLKDVETYEINLLGVTVSAYNRAYTFKEFSGESGLAFVSNYLRLTAVNSGPPERVSRVLPDPLEKSSVLPISAKPPNNYCKPKRSTARQSMSPAANGTFKSVIVGDGGLSTIYDVAYKASCIPLLLLTRILGFVVAMATSSLQATPFGFRPPQALTKFIAYAVLGFLAVSMVYLHLRVEQIPLSYSVKTQDGLSHGSNDEAVVYCKKEYQNLVATMHSLSQTLQRLEAKLTSN